MKNRSEHGKKGAPIRLGEDARHFGIRLSASHRDSLERISRKQGKTLSDLARQALVKVYKFK